MKYVNNKKSRPTLLQLARAADEICRGEKVECKDFVSVRRLDGKCNNLMNTTSTNWGASAIAMRRMAPTAYDDGHHTPRKVQLWCLFLWTFFVTGQHHSKERVRRNAQDDGCKAKAEQANIKFT